MKTYLIISSFLLSFNYLSPKEGMAYYYKLNEDFHSNICNILTETDVSSAEIKLQKNPYSTHSSLISSDKDSSSDFGTQDPTQPAVSSTDIHPLQATASEIIPWDYENVFGDVWDTSPFKAYKYEDIEFRLMFPNNYDSAANDGKKYPLILHIAGRGEAGDDNELQLRHAGLNHKNAIEEDRFPGYALFPQTQNKNGFASDKELQKYTEIIALLIRDNKVDPHRIYVHGFSAGGDATWRLIRNYPHLFAAALPMSWTHVRYVNSDSLIKRYIHIPIWISQGGKDDFPPAEQSNTIIQKIRNLGGNVRYKYLPNAGHGTWTAMYNDPDFYPYMLRHSKLDIHVYYGQTSFCPGEPFEVTLGISPGFNGYEWEKDGQPFASGADQHEIIVDAPGAYRVRFRRGEEWTEWSESVVIDNNREILPTPKISTSGKSRNLVTALDSSKSVVLVAPAGYENYIWKKNDVAIAEASTDSLTVSEAGSYTVAITEAGKSPVDENGVPTPFRPSPPRCQSAFSTLVVITTADGPSAPATPENFTVGTRSPFSLQIKWDDTSDNELGFEIYRATHSGGPYVLVTITPPDTTAYADENLAEKTTYYYKARAVNNSGGSAYTPEKSATTGEDTSVPDPPGELTLTPVSLSQIDLAWKDNAFNETGYKIYRSLSSEGSFELIHTTKENITSFSDTSLMGNTTYFYQILAFNKNGESAKVNSEGVSTLNGVPAIVPVAPQVVKTGDTLTVNITANDPESDKITLSTENLPNFTSFEDRGDGTGMLQVMPTSSDAGFHGGLQIVATDEKEGSSKANILLTVINRELVETVYINFGSKNAAGPPWNNTAQSPVANQLYDTLQDASSGNTANVQMKVLAGWDTDQVNGTTTQNNSGVFPDSILAKGWQTSDSAALELSGLDPNLLYNFTFLGSKTGFDNGETAFYTNGQKVVLNASKNVDNTVSLNGITPDAQGKVTISITKSGASAKGYLNALVIESYEDGIPIHPTNLLATPVSRTQIKLQWYDRAGNEEGYEIYRAIGPEEEFSLLTTTPADVNSFTDGELTNNPIYRYQIRAFNSLGNSNYSNEVSSTTLNQRILVNFNGSTHVMAPAPWNNTAQTPTEGAVIPDLKDDLENETDIDLVVEKWGTGFDNALGLTTGDNSGVYPDAVLKTYYFLEPYDEPVKLVFTGLDPQLSYNFTFFGDGGSGEVSDNLFMPGSDLRTQFIIEKDTVILNALDNTSETVQINNVTPQKNHSVTVNIKAYEGATVETSAIFGIFNAIVIDGYYSKDILMNNAPVIASVETQSFEEGDTVSVQITANDADGDPITFSAKNLPAGLNIDSVTGLITGVVSQGTAVNSPYIVEVTANDSLPVNNLAKMTFSIQIIKPTGVCPSPTALSAEPKIIGETAGAILSWMDDDTAIGYIVRYREIDSTEWKTIKTENATSQITLKNLSYETEYEWSLQGQCAEGAISDTSAIQTFKTLSEPVEICETPQNVSAELLVSDEAPSTVIITWNTVSSALSYEIAYSTDSTNWTSLTSTETSVTLTDLLENMDYHVLVHTVCSDDGDVVSDNAYTTFAIDASTEICEIPENLAVIMQEPNDSTVDVTLAWEGPNSAEFYYVLYAEKEVASWEKMKVSSDTTVLKDFLPETTYRWAVITGCSSDETLLSDTSVVAEFTTEPVDVISGLDEDLHSSVFKVYPVPSQGTFTVEYVTSYAAKIHIMVCDVLGAVVYQTEEKTPEIRKQLHLPIIQPGIYFIKLIDGDQVYSKRILIQQKQ